MQVALQNIIEEFREYSKDHPLRKFADDYILEDFKIRKELESNDFCLTEPRKIKFIGHLTIPVEFLN